MATIKKINSNAETTYPVYFSECDTIRELPNLAFPTKYFTLLVCADFGQITTDELFEAAERLLEKGIGCFCVWGPGCERAHDVFDEAISDRILNGKYVSDDAMMTTWHTDESLDEALWFAINVATVHSDHWDDCCTIIVSVADNAYARQLWANLVDLAAFEKRQLEE